MEYFDEENRNLGTDWLEVPWLEPGPKKDKERYWPYDVFLRLPREVIPKVSATNYQPFGTQDPRLFRYTAGERYNFFVAAGLIAEPKDKEKDKDNKPRPLEWPVDVFRELVRAALTDFYRKEYKYGGNPNFPAFNKRDNFQKYRKEPKTDRGTPLPVVDYEGIGFTDSFNATRETSFFQAYFHENEKKQVAIIIQYPLAWKSDANANTAIDWSLKSLDLNSRKHPGQAR